MKRKFKVPHTLVILFSMVVLAQFLTYVIPAGSFERVETETGRMQVVPGSFHLTPEAPAVSPFASLTAIPKGFSSAHEIIFFVFIIGGMFAVLRATGTLEAAMASLLRRWGKQPFWLIAGGIFYTSGVVFFVLDNWFPWCHGIWHLFVIAGSTCHYFSILLL